MNRYFTVKKNDWIYYIICLVLCLFGMTGYLLNYLLPSVMLRIILAVVLTGVSLVVFFWGKKVTKKDAFLVGWIGLMILMVFNNSAWGRGSTFVYISVLCSCLMLARTERILDFLLPAMMLIYTFYALCTIFFYFNGDFYMNHVVDLFPDTKHRLINWYNQGYMAGLTAHYSTNGMFLISGVILACCGLFRYKKSVLYWLWIAILVAALLLTGKRGHILFGAMTLFALYLLSIRDKDISKRILKIIGIVLGVLTVGGILLVTVPSLAGFINRFKETISEGNIAKGRYDLWALGIDAFKEKPILGIGWKQFAPTLSPLFSLDHTYDTHNVYVQLLCETGVVGFVIYISWFVTMIVTAVMMFKKAVKHENLRMKYHMAVSFSFQAFFLMYCITGNPLYDSMMYMPYFICCGITIYYWFNYKKLLAEKETK